MSPLRETNGQFADGHSPSRLSVKRFNRACSGCGASFDLYPSQSARIFCSRSCSIKHQSRPANSGLFQKGRAGNKNQIAKMCGECGEYFTVKQSHAHKRTTCSKGCDAKVRQRMWLGSKNPAWQGGKTKESRARRGRAEWAVWRKEVFTRDQFTCQECGARGGALEPHHIKPHSLFPELVYEVENGITLCRDCHLPTIRCEHLFEQRYLSALAARRAL